MKISRLTLLILFLAFISILNGQETSKYDSLLKRLRNEKSDTARVMLNYRISYELQFSDPEEAEKYARASLDEAERIGFRKGRGSALVQMGNISQARGKQEEAERYYREALEIMTEIKDLNGAAICLNNLGITFHNRTEYREALRYYRQSIDISRKTGKRPAEATSLFCIGTVYENLAKYDSALVCFLEAQAISEETGDSKLIAVAKTSLANIYYEMDNMAKAEEYYREAIVMFEKTGNKLGLLKSYYSLGQVFERNNKYTEALNSYTTALNLSFELGSYSDMANLNRIIGGLYESSGTADSAFVYYYRAMYIYRASGNNESTASMLTSLARLENARKNFAEAKEYLSEALDIAEKTASQPLLSSVYREMAATFAGTNDYKKAFRYLEKYSGLKDSLMTEEKQKQILELQTKYETERKENENLLLRKDRQILTTTRNSLVIGALLLSLVIILIIRSLAIKKRDNKLLRQQKEEIRRQKDIVEMQKTSITDSIRYARRIQTAMLPPDDVFREELEDSFILYLPRDIVSGDFYYLRKLDDSTILACAADCTGHGVPGAFMSMLGMSVLNDIVNTNLDDITAKRIRPGEILDRMRIRIKSSLRQTGREGETRDGMDLSLCLIEKVSGRMWYSGANNPVYFVSDGILNEIKATRNPIGVYVNEVSFETHEVTIPGGSVLYMFSDGYSDQIGEGGKKFLSRNFKSLLSGISHLPMNEIKDKLHERHLEWKNGEEQVDDILVLGIKI